MTEGPERDQRATTSPSRVRFGRSILRPTSVYQSTSGCSTHRWVTRCPPTLPSAASSCGGERHHSPLGSNPRTIWQPDYPQEVTAPVNKHAFCPIPPPPALVVGRYQYLDGPCSGAIAIGVIVVACTTVPGQTGPWPLVHSRHAPLNRNRSLP
jgi:hypothetical protein